MEADIVVSCSRGWEETSACVCVLIVSYCCYCIWSIGIQCPHTVCHNLRNHKISASTSLCYWNEQHFSEQWSNGTWKSSLLTDELLILVKEGLTRGPHLVLPVLRYWEAAKMMSSWTPRLVLSLTGGGFWPSWVSWWVLSSSGGGTQMSWMFGSSLGVLTHCWSSATALFSSSIWGLRSAISAAICLRTLFLYFSLLYV